MNHSHRYSFPIQFLKVLFFSSFEDLTTIKTASVFQRSVDGDPDSPRDMSGVVALCHETPPSVTSLQTPNLPLSSSEASKSTCTRLSHHHLLTMARGRRRSRRTWPAQVGCSSGETDTNHHLPARTQALIRSSRRTTSTSSSMSTGDRTKSQ